MMRARSPQAALSSYLLSADYLVNSSHLMGLSRSKMLIKRMKTASFARQSCLVAIFCAAPLLALAQEQIIAQPLICGGAEPFWSLETSDGPEAQDALFTTPGAAPIGYETALITKAQGRPDPLALTLIAPQDTAIAIIAARPCSDTMSDIDYSHTIELLTQRQGEAVMFTGCCRLRP